MTILRKHVGAVAGIILVTVISHAPALWVPFVWDDFETHVQNPHMQRAPELLRYLDPSYWRASHPVLRSPYRPIREMLLGAIRSAFGPIPTSFHLLALAGHTANAALVYVVALLILKGPFSAFLAGMTFALHPSHVEVVAWTKNIGEVASVFFALLSIIAYLRFVHRLEYHGSSLWWIWGGGSLVCFVLALLTKESAVAVPLILTAWTILCTRGAARRWGLLGTVPLWAVAAFYLALQFRSEELTGRAELAAWVVPSGVWLRALLVMKTVAEYVRVLLFPLPHVPWRDFRITGGEPIWQHVGVCAIIAAIGVGWIWAAARWPAGALAIFWTIAAMGPASNLVVNVGRPIAEQRLYFPSIGFALLLGATANIAPTLRRRSAQSAWIALWAIYAILLVHALMIWRDERTLWVYSTRHAPEHSGPHLNLGNAYTKVGYYPSAVAEYSIVRRLKPNYLPGLINLGGVLGRMYRFDEALDVLHDAASRFPDAPSVYNNLGTVSFRRSEWHRDRNEAHAAAEWLARAAAHFRHTLELDPNFPSAYANLGNCYLETGEFAKAREMFERALELLPEFPEALYNYARLYMAENKPREALKLFSRAAELNPNISGLLAQIALAHEALEEWEAAATAWRRAVAQFQQIGAPPHVLHLALSSLASVEERLGNRSAAHEAWQQALRLAPADPEALAGAKRTSQEARPSW